MCALPEKELFCVAKTSRAITSPTTTYSQMNSMRICDSVIRKYPEGIDNILGRVINWVRGFWADGYYSQRLCPMTMANPPPYYISPFPGR